MSQFHFEEYLKWIVFFLISFLVLILDQGTKLLVLEHIRYGETRVVWEGLLNWTHVHNPGAAFGFLANTPSQFREIFFLSVPPLALIIIFYLLRYVSYRDVGQVTSLGLVFGGALGNLIDRIRFRHVIDFIDFHFNQKWSMPAFNFADAAIIIGVTVLVCLVFNEKKELPVPPDRI